MKRIMWILLLCPLVAITQQKGIRFEERLNLSQIKAKARAENKYIFLDCYTTWCGPCKRMDKEVYTNDTVGHYFNNRFISVKVQLDETEKDDVRIKAWYADAFAIEKKYRIQSYPTYIFLSPDGQIVHKDGGFKLPKDLIQVAKIALTPGKTFDNVYARYDRLITDYLNGEKDYSQMPYMIMTAIQLNETDVARKIMGDYNEYVKTLDDDALYREENIQYFSSVISTKSTFFHLFYPNGKKIDSAMNSPGYAQRVVDTIIVREEVEPFIKVKDGGRMGVIGDTVKKLPEPDWRKLHAIIKKKFNTYFAKRNVLEAKIIWNRAQENDAYTRYFVEKWKRYGMGTDIKSDMNLNGVAWLIFDRINDKEQIMAAISWMEGVVKRSVAHPRSWTAATTDTYACLLYKIGKKKKAIRVQKNAVDIARADDPQSPLVTELQNRLKQMKENKSVLESNAFF